MGQPLLFGHACPQHPDRRIARVSAEPMAGRDGWLVTVRFACGHRHTQYSAALPSTVVDTEDGEHLVGTR